MLKNFRKLSSKEKNGTVYVYTRILLSFSLSALRAAYIAVSGIGDIVDIFSAEKGNTAADMAAVLGTIPYEVLTSVAKRVKRIYINE